MEASMFAHRCATSVPVPSELDTALSGGWSLVEIRQVLETLVGRAVGIEELFQTALGYGLLAWCSDLFAAKMNDQMLSRLLLAAYRVPGQVSEANWAEIEKHVAAGMRVMVRLPDHLRQRGLYEVLGLGGPGEDAVALRSLERCDFCLLSRSDFIAWSAEAGSVCIVSARAWSDLPTEGRFFFAGTRDLDGSYHWNTAECDTDGEGRIVRF
jgi:hypothetical protein